MRFWLSILLVLCLASGCATIHGPRQIDEVPPGGPAISDWTRERELGPAAEITVTTTRSPASPWMLVSVDDSHLTVLNVGNPALSRSSVRILREMAVRYPDAFSATHAGSLVQDDVRVGSDGVFVGNRKVAAFDEIVEAIGRGDVIEIDGPVVARGSVAGSALGGWLGFALGAIPALGGAESGVAWPVLGGSIAFGACLGHRWSSHTTVGVIYRVR